MKIQISILAMKVAALSVGTMMQQQEIAVKKMQQSATVVKHLHLNMTTLVDAVITASTFKTEPQPTLG